MKQFIAVMLIALAFAGALTLPASSQTADSLDAVVTPFSVAISIDTDTVNFGTMSLSAADDDRSTKESAAVTVTNSGSSPADLVIQGSNATPGIGGEAIWTLSCAGGISNKGTVGTNQFALLFAPPGNPIDWASAGNSLCPLATKPLQAGVSGGGSAMFVLQMNMPTSTTGFSPRTSTVTVTAVQAP